MVGNNVVMNDEIVLFKPREQPTLMPLEQGKAIGEAITEMVYSTV